MRSPQVQHASDSFLALTTDGINFLLSDQEICDVINQCHDAAEAADVIAQRVLNKAPLTEIHTRTSRRTSAGCLKVDSRRS